MFEGIQTEQEMFSMLSGLFLFLVVLIVSSLIFWPSYNHSVVKMSTDPATNKPRLAKIDFTQALLFVIVLCICKSVQH